MAAENRTTFVSPLCTCTAEERWRPVVGFEGIYEVSSHGRVRSCTRRVRVAATWRRGPTWKTIKSQMRRPTHGGTGSPYPRVHLWCQHREVCRMVHHLVLEAFAGARPRRAVANHLDGDKQHNCTGNLAWCSRSQNALHAIESGLVRGRGEESAMHKSSTEQVREIRRLARAGTSFRDIERALGVPYARVWKIVRRRTWRHVPED